MPESFILSTILAVILWMITVSIYKKSAATDDVPLPVEDIVESAKSKTICDNGQLFFSNDVAKTALVIDPDSGKPKQCVKESLVCIDGYFYEVDKKSGVVIKNVHDENGDFKKCTAEQE